LKNTNSSLKNFRGANFVRGANFLNLNVSNNASIWFGSLSLSLQLLSLAFEPLKLEDRSELIAVYDYKATSTGLHDINN
jgi:hypothetical protein